MKDLGTIFAEVERAFGIEFKTESKERVIKADEEGYLKDCRLVGHATLQVVGEENTKSLARRKSK